MPEERKYAYKIQNTPESFMGIMYHLGSYYVAAFVKGEKGVIARTLRKYKTLRGAEMFLLKDYPKTKRDAPEISYGTEKFINEGTFWRNI